MVNSSLTFPIWELFGPVQSSSSHLFTNNDSSDLSQTSHCNIKGLSVSEVMRTENMINQVKLY